MIGHPRCGLQFADKSLGSPKVSELPGGIPSHRKVSGDSPGRYQAYAFQRVSRVEDATPEAVEGVQSVPEPFCKPSYRGWGGHLTYRVVPRVGFSRQFQFRATPRNRELLLKQT